MREFFFGLWLFVRFFGRWLGFMLLLASPVFLIWAISTLLR